MEKRKFMDFHFFAMHSSHNIRRMQSETNQRKDSGFGMNFYFVKPVSKLRHSLKRMSTFSKLSQPIIRRSQLF